MEVWDKTKYSVLVTLFFVLVLSLFSDVRVLTDIDINSYNDDTLDAPSVASYRMNEDVLCIQPASLRPSGSFRSSRNTTGAIKRPTANPQDTQPQLIKFRERSYSDIQRVDRRLWRPHVDAQFQ